MVVVPTNYYKTPTALLESLGVNMVIWANHNLRSAVQAIKSTCQTIYTEQSLVSVEGQVSLVTRVSLTKSIDISSMDGLSI